MKKTSTKIKQSRADRIVDIANISLLCIILVVFIYPLLFVLSASLSDPNAVWGGEVWVWPVGFTLEGYEEIFANSELWNSYANSIKYTVVGTAFNVLITITCAYPISRPDFKARNIIMKFYVFTMFFGGGLIPTFLVVKNLGLLDTMWALILPSFASVTNIIIARTFFQSNIPGELREAAFLDGSSNVQFLVKIVIPLSKPIIAVLVLYYGITHWNSYFQAMIYISSREKYPLQIILREIILENSDSGTISGLDPELVTARLRLAEIVKYGVIVVATLPALIIYPFMQKYFVKGVMIGSLKG